MGDALPHSCQDAKSPDAPPSDFKPKGKNFIAILTAVVLTAFGSSLAAQTTYCGPNVPTFVVNMVGNPSGTWISPAVQRADQCCGALPPDECVQFIVTLDSNAQGILFDVYSGAMPPGALYYQVNCGPPTPVGTPICLNGPGPHTITFCKPGNNNNQYIITSLQQPTVSSGLILNNGCSALMGAAGFNESTVTWTSIYPGPTGTYNSYLSCTSGCDTVLVTAMSGAPPYVDYQVCGYNIAGCIPLLVCDTVRVYFNAALVANITPINPTICYGNTGITLTANVTGGSTPYSYTWSTGAQTQSIFAGPGTYTVTVTDASNCPGTTATVTVTSFTVPITANAGPDQSLCITSLPVQLAGSVTGATGGIWGGGSGTFSPNNTTLNATYTPTAAEIASGQVTLSLITTGNGPCPGDTDYVIISLHQFESALSTTFTPALCFGQSNGSATVTISAGNGPFVSTWNTTPVQTGNTASNLAAGSYTVTVTDVYGCSGTATATVTQPPVLTTTGSSTNVTCNAACNGTATAVPAGGTSPYTYSWSPTGGNSSSASSLCAGPYTCTVTDANGCTTTHTYSITQPAALSVTIVATQATCGNPNGSATVTVTGGTGTYTYSWSPSGGNGATASGLAAGNYSCLITDSNSCTITATVNVPNAPAPTATITAFSNISCFGGSNGSITVTASGGSGSYTYSWSPSGGNGATASGLAIGTYVVTVTDSNSCTATATYTLTQPTQLTATATATDVLCFGGSTGTATTTASGGVGPYSYSWNTTPVQATSTATSMPAGNYTCTVTDANGCTTQATVIISEPPQLTLSAAGVPATCNAACNGQLVAVPGGGVQPYNLLWSSGCTALSCMNVCAGAYTVQLTDANGCTTSASATVTEPPALVATYTSTGAHCNTASGTLTANVSGGSGPYTYVWTPGNIQSQTATNLLPGSYQLLVTDAQNCTVTITAQVNNIPGVVAAVTNINNPLCDAACTGSATASATGGNSPYNFTWSNSSTGPAASGLCAGSYLLTITDADGCMDTASFSIQTPPPVVVTPSTPATLCPGQSTTLTATATGGTPGYTYTWSSGSPTVTPNGTTSYTVFATDINGCTSATATVTVNVYPPLSVTASGGGNSCFGVPVQLSATAGGGNGGPYTYTWMPGNLVGQQVTVTPINTMTYTVTVTDGCSSPAAVATVTINILSLPVVSFISDDTAGCQNICVQFTNTTPNAMTWLWDFGDGNNSNAASPSHCYPDAGNYSVSLTVSDNNGCMNTVTYPSMIVVHPNPAADFALGPQPTTILNPEICYTDLSSSDVTQWYWNFGDPNDQTTSYIQAPCHSYSDTGTFCTDLVVHNTYGCMAMVEYCLRIDPYFAIYVPNAFTPNADGINDGFRPVMINVLPDDYELIIFDRWGNVIFKTTDINGGWDGKANNGNEIAQIDAYVWKIRVTDYTGARHELIGHVSLIK